VLESEEFRDGRAHTGWQLQPRRNTEHDEVFAAVAKAYVEDRERARRMILPSVPIGYRNNPYDRRIGSSGYRCIGASENQQSSNLKKDQIEILRVTEETVEALVDGIRYEFKVTCAAEGGHGPDSLVYHIRSSLGQRTVTRLPRFPRRAGAGERQTANSPMPGQVLRILVAQGQRVKMGDALIALEAMKMEQTIKATMDGIVGGILVKTGDIVTPGQKLIEIQAEKSNEHADSSAASD